MGFSAGIPQKRGEDPMLMDTQRHRLVVDEAFEQMTLGQQVRQLIRAYHPSVATYGLVTITHKDLLMNAGFEESLCSHKGRQAGIAMLGHLQQIKERHDAEL